MEDNVDAAETLAELLALWGHDVRVVHDGAMALEVVAAYRPEAILLDIGLPGMSGYQVARRLRQEGLLEGVLLVALTGYGQQEARREAEEAGIPHYLTKPVDPDSLRQLLTHAPVG